jgi:hypothetical protein
MTRRTEETGTAKALFSKSYRKKLLSRYRCRWDDNNKMKLRKIVWEDVKWTETVQDTVQWRVIAETVMNI